jgi:hypothetical protein
MSAMNPRPFYFSQIRIDPANDQRVYLLGFALFVSDDAGKNFREDLTEKTHPDDHALAWAIGHRELTRRHTVSVVLDQGLCDARAGLSEYVLSYVDRHRDVLELRSTPHVVPGGEAAKNDPGVIEALHRIFAAERLDRQSAVLIVGGGAVLDAAGYAASTVHRGMRVVRMPSTVLAQNDGGVGVKTGVNAWMSSISACPWSAGRRNREHSCDPMRSTPPSRMSHPAAIWRGASPRMTTMLSPRPCRMPRCIEPFAVTSGSK